jgi:hypothetical protein
VLVAVVGVGLAAPAWGASVVDLRIGRHADFTRIVFELDTAAGYQLELARPAGQPPSIVVVLDARALPQVRAGAASGLVESVQIEPRGSTSVARIRLRTDRPRIEEIILSSPPRIVLDVIEEKLAAAPPAPPAPSRPAPRAEAPPAPAPALRAEAPPAPAPKAAEPAPAPTPAPRRIDPEPVPAPPEEVAPAPTAPTTPPPEAQPEPEETDVATTPAPAPQPIRPPRTLPTAPPGAAPGVARSEPSPGMPRTAPAPGVAPGSPPAAARPWEPPADEGWSGRQIAAAAILLGLFAFVLLRLRRKAPDRPRRAPKPLERAEPDLAPGRARAVEPDVAPSRARAIEPDLATGRARAIEPTASPRPVLEPELWTAVRDEVPEPAPTDARLQQGSLPWSPRPEPELVRPPPPVAAPPAPAAAAPAASEGEVARRIEQLELRIEDLIALQERLERQIHAHNEELRVQRAAIARTQRVVRGLVRPEDKLGDPEDDTRP